KKTCPEIKITASTCPHYFSLTDEAIEDYNTYAKVMPPLRTKEDTEAIKEGLLDGTIDIISTGHTPVSVERKNTEFDNAPFGISALETAFSVALSNLVDNDKFKLKDLVEKMSTKPAELLRLENKGKIKEGYDADLIIVDVNEEYEVNPEDFLSKAKYSPYSGMKFRGKVLSTFVGGKCIEL
ncbi:MAG: amidohydrolase family protein, partial [Firmicutes bacterium]|nr:amidohydrolase family protein [Bacillota bacterium]